MEPEREYDRLQTLEQLVREALDGFTNPRTTVDLHEWSKTARRVLEPPVVTGRDRYHAHLEACPQCRDNPFNHCEQGYRLLRAAVDEP